MLAMALVLFAIFYLLAVTEINACSENSNSDENTIDPPNKYPFMVTINHENFRCGGVLVHHQWVLTSAHCIKQGDHIPDKEVVDCSSSLEGFKIGLGVSHVDEPVFTRDLEEIRIHPMYKKFQNDDYGQLADVALVKLSCPITYNSVIQPICLPAKSYSDGPEELSKKSITIAGWGETDANGPIDKFLKSATITILPKEECYDGHGFTGKKRDFMRFLLCSSNDPEIRACKHDLGYPVFTRENDRYLALGFSLPGPPNCKDKPVVYTQLRLYTWWIKQVIPDIPDEECGKFDEKITKLSGCSEDISPQYPFMVKISNNNFLCGGVLIHPQWVMTAAHCVKQHANNKLPGTEIITDKSFLCSLQVGVGVQDSGRMKYIRHLEEIRIHPMYGKFEPDNEGHLSDIAILKMSSPVTYDFNIQSICLPNKVFAEEENEMAIIVSEWETTDDSEALYSHLKVASVGMSPPEECVKAHSLIDEKRDFMNFLLCIENHRQKSDGLAMDPGTLLFGKLNERHIALGITLNNSMCQPTNPVLYTKLSIYEWWVRQIIPDIYEHGCGSEPYPFGVNSLYFS